MPKRLSISESMSLKKYHQKFPKLKYKGGGGTTIKEKPNNQEPRNKLPKDRNQAPNLGGSENIKNYMY